MAEKFSEGYLYEQFQKNYREGLDAMNRGEKFLAKDKFFKASNSLSELAEIGNPSRREERLRGAARLKAISDALPSRKAEAEERRPSFKRSEAAASDADMSQFLTFYSAEELAEGFEGVVGLEEAKAAVTEYVILPHRHPEAYNYHFLDNRAILLEGPPGTGKTTFAKAVSKEIDQPFALINVAALVNCYVGETAKNIDRVFDFLREFAEKNHCGVTVFIDEIDEIAKRRGGDDKASEAAIPALLRNLDGMKGNKNFLILANTNRKDVIDSAILQRFRKQLFIPLPNAEIRRELFRQKLKEIEPSFFEELDLDGAVERSEGLSGRDIAFLCDDFKYFLSRFKAGLTDENVSEKFNALIREKRAQTEV